VDPFKTLGVPRTSSEAQIREAYRARAQVVHPDRLATMSERVRREGNDMMRDLNVALEDALTWARLNAGQADQGTSSEDAGGQAKRSAADGSRNTSSQFVLTDQKLRELRDVCGALPCKVSVRLNGLVLGPRQTPVVGLLVEELMAIVKPHLPNGGRVRIDNRGVTRLSDKIRIVSFVSE
jgi:hypothetical protein